MSGLNSVPVIRLTVEGMQASILHAFTEYAAQMDADIQAAVKSITPEQVTQLVREEAQKSIKRAVEKEMHDFYMYGEGRQFVREAVAASLVKRAEEFKKWGA